MKGSVWTFAYILAGILALAAAILTFGNNSEDGLPELGSYQPGGVNAFGQLLRQNGFEVVENWEEVPKLEPNDIVVAFLPQESNPKNEFEESTRKWIRAGGRAVFLPVEEDFSESSRTALDSTDTVSSFSGRKATVSSTDSVAENLSALLDPKRANLPLWHSPRGPLVWLTQLNRGKLLVFSRSLWVTNRFIDRNDNATVALSSLLSIAKPGDRFVFADAAFGKARPVGLLRSIGAWAEAAWFQLLFLFVVMIFSLGKRFGIAEPVRPKQTGTRELIDAYADTLQRSKATKYAVHAALERSRSEIASGQRGPIGSVVPTRVVPLPEGLSQAIREAEEAVKMDRLPPTEALRIVKKVENSLAEFRAVETKAPRRRKRSTN